MLRRSVEDEAKHILSSWLISIYVTLAIQVNYALYTEVCVMCVFFLLNVLLFVYFYRTAVSNSQIIDIILYSASERLTASDASRTTSSTAI